MLRWSHGNRVSEAGSAGLGRSVDRMGGAHQPVSAFSFLLALFPTGRLFIIGHWGQDCRFSLMILGIWHFSKEGGRSGSCFLNFDIPATNNCKPRSSIDGDLAWFRSFSVSCLCTRHCCLWARNQSRFLFERVSSHFSCDCFWFLHWKKLELTRSSASTLS